jgi:hypothetical protein
LWTNQKRKKPFYCDDLSMKKSVFFILAAAFVAVAVFGSLYLIPNKQEMALTSYKDKEYGEALKIYEEEFKQGRVTLDTATHLVGVYLQYAEIEKAITVMEAYVERNPNDLDARRELGRLYQYGQREDDYIRNLEKINAISSSEKFKRTLSASYTVSQEDEKNIPLLLEMVMKENSKNANPQDYKNLIRLLASTKRYDEALKVLQALRDRFPEKMDFSDHELALRLYADLNQPEQVQEYATSLANVTLAAGEKARVANILLYRVNAQAALTYIEAYKNEIDGSLELMEQYIVILVNTGKEQEAYALMQTRYQQGTLPVGLHDELFALASKFGNEELVAKLRDNIDYASLDESEILSLIDLSQSRKDAALFSKLEARAQALASESGDYYLQSVLMVIKGDASANGKIETIMREEPSFSRRLQLALMCARRGVDSCVSGFLDTLPPAEGLTDAEVVAVAEVMRNTKQLDTAYQYLATARTARNSTVVDAAWFPLAAVHDSTQAISAYLNEHGGSLTANALSDGYYMAMAQGKTEAAVVIAEHFYALDKSDANQNLIAQAYLKAGRYEEVLPMFRNKRDANAQAEGDYLFVLSKLARRDAKYADELGEYGMNILNGSADKKRRMNIIYALVDAGQQNRVMPYVRDLALASPHEWAGLYAEYLAKGEGQGAVNAFWMDVLARHPNDTKLKTQIAYNMLEKGDKETSMRLFKELAANEPADSPLVAQLLYLWSPIAPQEGIEWMVERANRTQNADERTAWFKHINDATTDEGLLVQAQANPELLSIASVEDRYLEALQRTTPAKELPVVIGNYVTPRVQTATDSNRLAYYGEVAQANRLHTLSQTAYGRALELSPNNPKLVSRLATAYYGEADYSRAQELLNHYFTLDVPEGQLSDNAEAHRPHFYYAELMRREKKQELANPHYSAVIKAAETAPSSSDTELQSMAARSHAFSGNPQKGKAMFKSLMQQYPADRQLRADYSSMLVELHDREAAEQSLPAWKQSLVAADEQMIPLSVSATQAVGYQLVDGNAAVILQHPEGAGALALGDVKRTPWISYAREGRDQTMLVAASGYQFEVMQGAEGGTWLHPVKIANGQQQALDESFAIQNTLMQARLEVETGRSYAASQRSRALVKQHPDNAQVLGFSANVENFIGNWPYARKLINKAHGIQPLNEDIITLQRGIERLHASNIYLDGEWKRLDESDMFITSAGGTYDVNDKVQVGLKVQNNSVDSQQLRFSNGRIGSSNTERQRGEVFARYFDDAGSQSQLSVFGNNDTAGVGAYHSFVNRLGFTNLGVEYHRPNWDFVEGVIDDATRDRVEIGHRYSPTDKIILTGELGVNRYNTEYGDDLVRSTTVAASASYRLHEQPYVAVGYGLDAEYTDSKELGLDSAGRVSQRFPLDSREVHSLNVFGSHDFTENTNAEGFAAYGYDRMTGDSGPSVEGRVTHYLDDRLSVQGRAGYGFRGAASLGDVTNAGVRLQYRY